MIRIAILCLFVVLAIGIMTMPVGHTSQGIAYRADLTATYPNSVNTGDTFTIDFIFDPTSPSVDEIVNNESARYGIKLPSEFIVHTEFNKKTMTHVDKYEKHGMYNYDNNFTVDNIEGDKLTGSISITLNQDLVHSIDKILLQGELISVGIIVEKTETGVKFSDWDDEKIRSIYDDENRYVRARSFTDSPVFDFETYVPRERKTVNGASDWLPECITETKWNEIKNNREELKKYDGPGCVIFDPILYYLPAHTWEGYAEFLRQIQNDFDLIDVRYYLQNDDYFSQEFIDDYLIAYPEFRIQSFDVSPYHQMKMGVPIDEIQCGVDKILMESKSGKPYCLSEDTAIKLADRGFSAVVLKEIISMNENVELSKTVWNSKDFPSLNSNENGGNNAAPTIPNSLFPKIATEIPSQVRIGEEFIVTVHLDYSPQKLDGHVHEFNPNLPSAKLGFQMPKQLELISTDYNIVSQSQRTDDWYGQALHGYSILPSHNGEDIRDIELVFRINEPLLYDSEELRIAGGIGDVRVTWYLSSTDDVLTISPHPLFASGSDDSKFPDKDKKPIFEKKSRKFVPGEGPVYSNLDDLSPETRAMVERFFMYIYNMTAPQSNDSGWSPEAEASYQAWLATLNHLY